MNEMQQKIERLKIDRPEEPQQRLSWIPFAGLALLAVAAAVFWASRPRAVAVRTAEASQVEIGDRQTVLNASGYVTARRQATVSSKVTGKVEEVLIEEGMRVAAGDVLATLDDTNARAALRLAEAQAVAARRDVEETRVRLDEARLELRRIENLLAEGVASQADLDRARAEVESLAARLETRRAAVEVADRQVIVARQSVEDLTIRAPFDGIVVAKNAQPGEMISPMSAGGGFTRTGIGTVVDMASLEVEVDVNEAYINRVQPGQAVDATLDSYPDWKIPARVIAIIPTADRQTATVQVRIGFDQLDPRILPDMGVKVAFKESTDNAGPQRAVVVPRAAVRSAGNLDVVFVVDEGRAERRAVKVGETVGEETRILSGLAAGERVVVEGPATLADGDRVEEGK